MCRRFLISILIALLLMITLSSAYAAPAKDSKVDIYVWPRYWQWEKIRQEDNASSSSEVRSFLKKDNEKEFNVTYFLLIIFYAFDGSAEEKLRDHRHVFTMHHKIKFQVCFDKTIPYLCHPQACLAQRNVLNKNSFW